MPTATTPAAMSRVFVNIVHSMIRKRYASTFSSVYLNCHSYRNASMGLFCETCLARYKLIAKPIKAAPATLNSNKKKGLSMFMDNP